MQALFNSLGCQNHMGAHSGLDLAGGGEVLQPSLDDLMDLDPMAPLQVSLRPASWPPSPGTLARYGIVPTPLPLTRKL